MIRTFDPKRDTLDRFMEFYQIIHVKPDGSIVTSEGYVPDAENDSEHDMLINGHPYDEPGEWTALAGFTGQWSYNGPVMHESEYIGGRMADYIATTPGFYVAVPVIEYVECKQSEEHEDEDVEFCLTSELCGWTVLTSPCTCNDNDAVCV